ncbi:SH3 domain-containing protein [Actibacterium ureilyticum]|uniref:SH3 domain-containing protein n=1 Tax=Actibacterium ureilyticum TaxID=1590614 RepID=UPI001595102D|nr:SH3 domain-containing protein [Actibacterium ureilyticum]
MSGALFVTSGDGHSQEATLQKAAFTPDDQMTAAKPASEVIKKRVTFHVPQADRMIFVDQRDAPAGYVNTRPFAIATAPEPATGADTDTDWRRVTGNSVNLRAGPGTGNAVVGRLTKGTRAIALQVMPNGWVHLDVPTLGVSGYMSGDFLTARN